MFDSHCHLTDLADPLAAVADARRSGVSSMLTCGYHAESNRAVLELRARLPELPCALGLHPWFANEPLDPVLRLVEAYPVTAVGEAGLDLWGEPPPQPFARQVEVLEAQLDRAVRLDLPITLHSRRAVSELFEVVRRQPRARGALHAFSGSLEQARGFVERGFLIGVGGAVTRSRARRIRRMAAALPLDAILLETDAPAIGLDGVEPPHVRPAHVVRVARALAELRGVAVEEIEAQTDANAQRLFGLSAQWTRAAGPRP